MVRQVQLSRLLQEKGTIERESRSFVKSHGISVRNRRAPGKPHRKECHARLPEARTMATPWGKNPLSQERGQ